MYRVTGAIAGAVFISAFACGSAYALPTFANGSFAFSESVSTTTDITSTTSYDNSGALNVTAAVNDFSGVLAVPSSITIISPTDFTSASSLDWTDSGIGSFSATGIINGGSTVLGHQVTQTWYVDGTFTVGGDYTNSGTPLTASETISLTQTGGPGNAVSMSGTFNSPAAPPPSAPEPATLAIVGAGLAGFAGLRRRGRKMA